MTYATPHSVGLRRRVLGAKDRYGKATTTYAPAEAVPVFAIYPATPDEVTPVADGSGLARDVDVLAPAWAGEPLDRAAFWGREWVQVGHAEPFNFGPFGFAPGVRVSFKRWEEPA